MTTSPAESETKTATSTFPQFGIELDPIAAKDVRPAEDGPLLLERFAKLQPGLETAGLWRHRKKDGTTIQVEVLGHSLTFRNRPAEMVLAIDITEKRRAQEALAALEQELEWLKPQLASLSGKVAR